MQQISRKLYCIKVSKTNYLAKNMKISNMIVKMMSLNCLKLIKIKKMTKNHALKNNINHNLKKKLKK